MITEIGSTQSGVREKITAHNLRQIRRCIDGTQPIDNAGAVMALDQLIAIAEVQESSDEN